MAIQQRLSPPQLAEAETKLAEVQRNIVPLAGKQRELSLLVQKKWPRPIAWPKSTNK